MFTVMERATNEGMWRRIGYFDTLLEARRFARWFASLSNHYAIVRRTDTMNQVGC